MCGLFCSETQVLDSKDAQGIGAVNGGRSSTRFPRLDSWRRLPFPTRGVQTAERDSSGEVGRLEDGMGEPRTENQAGWMAGG